MRQMLCVSDDPRPKSTCDAKSQFDVWSHHPYTYGGPTHRAFDPNDVSIGDLGEMRHVLDAAARGGHVQTRQKLRFWVTRFHWDTRPTDPKGLALLLHARWVSEALYRMWLERCQPRHVVGDYAMSGLRRACSSPACWLHGGSEDWRRTSRSRALLRFPVPVRRLPSERASAITFWGRTPTSTKQVRVIVEQELGSRWRQLVKPVGWTGTASSKDASTSRPGHWPAQSTTRRSQRGLSLPFSLVGARGLPVLSLGKLLLT